MIHGARAIVSRLPKHDDRRSTWLQALVARRGFNRTIVALANKTARIAWALLSSKGRIRDRLRCETFLLCTQGRDRMRGEY